LKKFSYLCGKTIHFDHSHVQFACLNRKLQHFELKIRKTPRANLTFTREIYIYIYIYIYISLRVNNKWRRYREKFAFFAGERFPMEKDTFLGHTGVVFHAESIGDVRSVGTHQISDLHHPLNVYSGPYRYISVANYGQILHFSTIFDNRFLSEMNRYRICDFRFL